MKRLIPRVKLLLQATLHDLFSEDDPPAGDQVVQMLDTIQAQLEMLRDDLAEAIARERRSEVEWRRELTLIQSLREQVNAALQTNDDEQARAHLRAELHAQERADALREHHQRYMEVTEHIRQALRDFRKQLDDARLQFEQLAEYERNADMLEQLNRLQLEQRWRVTSLREQLRGRGDEVAAREDQVDARDKVRRMLNGS